MSDVFIARASALASRILDGEAIIMSIPNSIFFVLDEVGTVIWIAADGHTSLAAIVEQKVCQEFDVNYDTAYSDACELVEEMAAQGILLLADSPIAGDQTASAL